MFERRRQRNRTQLKKVSNGRPRLSIHRTNQHMYAQIIDDVKGTTLAAASTLDKDLRSAAGSNADAATNVGKLIAERAKAAGVESVVFDRGGFVYHGRVKALAEAARAGGLVF
ncbi:50S ribosomal protein L18 [Temperatibacter marinus]|uniref:Large ribosomal subunit protein uL18 n=2 Tax=Temperatibacter marinus TaxID=1456591 RepID=A0AA52EER8_9PROT|nr:50S ribosomal protein L18 [Temperatibacter marinus]